METRKEELIPIFVNIFRTTLLVSRTVKYIDAYAYPHCNTQSQVSLSFSPSLFLPLSSLPHTLLPSFPPFSLSLFLSPLFSVYKHVYMSEWISYRLNVYVCAGAVVCVYVGECVCMCVYLCISMPLPVCSFLPKDNAIPAKQSGRPFAQAHGRDIFSTRRAEAAAGKWCQGKSTYRGLRE